MSITGSPNKDKTIDFLKQQLNLSREMIHHPIEGSVRTSIEKAKKQYNETLNNSRRSYENQIKGFNHSATYDSVNSSFEAKPDQ